MKGLLHGLSSVCRGVKVERRLDRHLILNISDGQIKQEGMLIENGYLAEIRRDEVRLNVRDMYTNLFVGFWKRLAADGITVTERGFSVRDMSEEERWYKFSGEYLIELLRLDNIESISDMVDDTSRAISDVRDEVAAAIWHEVEGSIKNYSRNGNSAQRDRYFETINGLLDSHPSDEVGREKGIRDEVKRLGQQAIDRARHAQSQRPASRQGSGKVMSDGGKEIDFDEHTGQHQTNGGAYTHRTNSHSYQTDGGGDADMGQHDGQYQTDGGGYTQRTDSSECTSDGGGKEKFDRGIRRPINPGMPDIVGPQSLPDILKRNGGGGNPFGR